MKNFAAPSTKTPKEWFGFPTQRSIRLGTFSNNETALQLLEESKQAFIHKPIPEMILQMPLLDREDEFEIVMVWPELLGLPDDASFGEVEVAAFEKNLQRCPAEIGVQWWLEKGPSNLSLPHLRDNWFVAMDPIMVNGIEYTFEIYLDVMGCGLNAIPYDPDKRGGEFRTWQFVRQKS